MDVLAQAIAGASRAEVFTLKHRVKLLEEENLQLRVERDRAERNARHYRRDYQRRRHPDLIFID